MAMYEDPDIVFVREFLLLPFRVQRSIMVDLGIWKAEYDASGSDDMASFRACFKQAARDGLVEKLRKAVEAAQTR